MPNQAISYTIKKCQFSIARHLNFEEVTKKKNSSLTLPSCGERDDDEACSDLFKDSISDTYICLIC